MNTPPFLKISTIHWQQILGQISMFEGEEICGFIAFENGQSEAVYPIENIDHSNTRFTMDPAQQIKAMLEIEKKDQQLMCIYHSHLYGPSTPSQQDIQEAFYPEALYLIIYDNHSIYEARSFYIKDEKYSETKISIQCKGEQE